ncbi:hypothetical protein [Brevibacterium sp. FAM 27836]|jgi:hypothetical protein|uniref:hypothetical protein n=1 Tax=Brevibacterium sp. FAM 27836 TaxID=3446693 RepID=UPI003F51632A
MARPLTAREHSVALFIIRCATTSPDESDYANFTSQQRDAWDPPVPITAEQRRTWENSLGEVLVTSECGCGICPSIGMRPRHRTDDDKRNDQGGDGDWSDRIVLTAGVSGAMLLLFIDDDIPSYLELAPTDDELSFAEFPEPESISI